MLCTDYKPKTVRRAKTDTQGLVNYQDVGLMDNHENTWTNQQVLIIGLTQLCIRHNKKFKLIIRQGNALYLA